MFMNSKLMSSKDYCWFFVFQDYLLIEKTRIKMMQKFQKICILVLDLTCVNSATLHEFKRHLIGWNNLNWEI